jgi:hypothetical protein
MFFNVFFWLAQRRSFRDSRYGGAPRDLIAWNFDRYEISP